MRAARCFAAAVAVTLSLLAGAAQAHKPSDAYLTLEDGGDGRVAQRLDIALRDLDRELDLDANADGELTWGEVRGRWPDLQRLATQAVVVGTAGRPCAVQAWAPPALVEHVDGRYAVLQATLRCDGAAASSLAIDYRLFAASDPTHRGIARIVHDGAQRVQVLVPGAAPVALATADAPSVPAPVRGWTGFFVEGLQHIASGADHLLFLATLLMVAVWRRSGAGWAPRPTAGSAWREALRLVTAFTVAHSLTLGLAAAGVLAPPTRWVESLIALSVFVAALDNLRPFLPGPRWLTVAAFGLVHGFGFAGPLQALGLRGTALALPLLGFNLGVEAGQLAVVLGLLPLALHWRARPGYARWVVRPASAVVALLALAWTVQRV